MPSAFSTQLAIFQTEAISAVHFTGAFCSSMIHLTAKVSEEVNKKVPTRKTDPVCHNAQHYRCTDRQTDRRTDGQTTL